ncbi:MAG: PHP-associated domain-containing protein [Gemmatimonadota bacterium]
MDHGDFSTLRIDLHAHTHYSPDGAISPQRFVERARASGLNRIAVTDHGTIEGALRARELAPDMVVIGEEIRCHCHAELIGLFLRERIPMYLPLESVVERIHDQGGIIYAPHPYAYAWRPLARARRVLAVADMVEAYNSRAFLPSWNRAASRAARLRHLPAGAGSDAHFPGEIGQAYTEMPGFEGALDFLAAARLARPVGVSGSGPSMHVASAGLKASRVMRNVARSLTVRPQPGRPAAARR